MFIYEVNKYIQRFMNLNLLLKRIFAFVVWDVGVDENEKEEESWKKI